MQITKNHDLPTKPIPGSSVRLTVLSDMTGQDLKGQLQRASDLGLTTLDLKTVFGKNVADLSQAEARECARAMSAGKIEAQAMSTHLFALPIENGEPAFRSQLDHLDRVLAIAQQLRPKMIRLIAAQTCHRHEIQDSSIYIQKEHPWLISLYREAVNRIAAAGFSTVIENETGGSIFAHAREIAGFFTALGNRDKVSFTWDIQNLWQMGTFPALEVYRQLRPFIGYVHLKGGIAGDESRAIKYRSTLESASWPVLEIVRAVIADGVSPVICLNPSHGEPHPDHPMDDAVARDLSYLRRSLKSSVL